MKVGEDKHMQAFSRRPCHCCHLKASQSGSRYKISSSPCSLVLASLPSSQPSTASRQLPSSSLIRAGSVQCLVCQECAERGHASPCAALEGHVAEALLGQTLPIPPQGMCLVLLQPGLGSDLLLLRFGLMVLGSAPNCPLAPRWLNSAFSAHQYCLIQNRLK